MITEEPVLLSSINLFEGALLIALSIPLILRKVPMNHLYGLRFRDSYTSDKNWYDINAAGGWILLGWSVPILLMGLFGVFVPGVTTRTATICLFIGYFCILAACVHAYRATRKIAKRNASI